MVINKKSILSSLNLVGIGYFKNLSSADNKLFNIVNHININLLSNASLNNLNPDTIFES